MGPPQSPRQYWRRFKVWLPIILPTGGVGIFVVDPSPPAWFAAAIGANKNKPSARVRNLPEAGARPALAMNAQQLLQEISDYCRRTGLAESTFGRRAVNDGKLTTRLRNGGRITTETLH